MATDYDNVRTFVAVAEAGGLGRAAHRLATSKSVVNRRLARPEADLGTRLLTRSNRSVVVTEAGEALRRRALSAFDELDGAL